MNLLPSWQEAIDKVDSTSGRVPGGPQPPNADRERAFDLLPAVSKDRLQTLRERLADSEAAAEGAITVRNDLMEKLEASRRRVKELTAPRSAGGHQLSATSPEVVEAEARVQSSKQALDRAKDRHNRLAGATMDIRQLVQNLERAIEGGGKMVAYEGHLPSDAEQRVTGGHCPTLPPAAQGIAQGPRRGPSRAAALEHGAGARPRRSREIGSVGRASGCRAFQSRPALRQRRRMAERQFAPQPLRRCRPRRSSATQIDRL